MAAKTTKSPRPITARPCTSPNRENNPHALGRMPGITLFQQQRNAASRPSAKCQKIVGKLRIDFGDVDQEISDGRLLRLGFDTLTTRQLAGQQNLPPADLSTQPSSPRRSPNI
ncbi:MAG: hypothetical protein ACREGF_03535 [Candidatus Saccharimonadales bacterium]